MPTVTTYTSARQALAQLCDQVAATQEPVVIRRRNKADVALIAADELASLMETARAHRAASCPRPQ
jgi:antitoxin YefM